MAEMEELMQKMAELAEKHSPKPSDMNRNLEEITENLLKKIDIEQMQVLTPTVFLYHFDYAEGEGEMRIGILEIPNLEDTVEGRVEQFYHIGKGWAEQGPRLPLYIFFLVETWMGSALAGKLPSQQENRVEGVMVTGMAVDRNMHTMRIFKTTRNEENVMQLEELTTIKVEDAKPESKPVMLSRFFDGYFDVLEARYAGSRQAGSRIIH